ncbi:MAG: hypothetical protein QXK37_06425 [Candidatus Woesearchaeota archaeon]
MRHIFVIFFVFLFLAGCSESECEKNSDCLMKECSSAKCVDGKCSYTKQPNCCGNQMCETEKGENWCSCQKDCINDKCEGSVVLETNKYGTINAKYLKKFCLNNKCITGVDPKDIHEVPILDERQLRSLKFSSVVKFNEPFDINKDSIRIDITLKDIGSDIAPPIKFTEIKIISGEILYGSKKINREISEPGQSFTETVPITYVPSKVEEQKRINIKIDYEYNQIADKFGAVRRVTETYDNALNQPIYLVNPTGIK